MERTSCLQPSFWDQTEDRFYQKVELYSLSWAAEHRVDLSGVIGSGAAFGGPVALTNDPKKLVRAVGKKGVTLFNAAGTLLTHISFDAKLVTMGWSLNEDLILVKNDGSILMYSFNGKPINVDNPVSFGSEVRDIGVFDARVFLAPNGDTSGVAVLTEKYSFYAMTNVEQTKSSRKYADVPGLTIPPTCWCVIFPEVEREASVKGQPPQIKRKTAILVARDKQLFTLPPDGQAVAEPPVSLVKAPVNAFVAMALSINRKNLALMSDTGLIWLGSSDMKTKFCEFDTHIRSAHPKDFVWCGSTAVVAYIPDPKNLIMVDESGEFLKYPINSDVILVPEIDGLRIIGTNSHEMLMKIPDAIEKIVRVGSLAPGAFLFLASEEFQRESAKSNEYLDAYRSELDVAVSQCIQAAGEAYFSRDQEKLLRAASFGKSFCADYSPDGFVKMCRELRVLNNIRDYNVGVPLTYQQSKLLSMNSIVDRMIFRNLWPLAVKICEYLQMPEAEGTSRVKTHWACWKVSQDKSRDSSDEAIAEVIRSKLKNAPGISYADIAKRAVEFGRNELAIQLLNYEPRSSQQIPLLIKLDRQSLALDKAISSGDTFLIYDVILHLKKSMSRQPFLQLLSENRRAQSYYLKYLAHWDRDKLFQIYGQDDDFLNQALCRVEESYAEAENTNKIHSLKDAKLHFMSASKSGAVTAATRSNLELYQQMAEEQARLYKYQQELEDAFRQPRSYFGLSLHETVVKLTAENRAAKYVDGLKKDFRITEKKFWWMRIQGLAQKGDWTELEKFSRTKKSPIGYMPFIDLCVKYNMLTETDKYIIKVPPEERVKPYMRVGNLEKAAEQAFNNKNPDDLRMILGKCASNPSLAGRIRQNIVDLEK